MKAVVYTKYGSPQVLQLKNIEKPKQKTNEILIKVHYSTVNRTDCGFRSAKYFVSRFFTGLIKPKYTVPGSEFAGEVVEVGADITEYKVGDRVFGFDDVRGGANAEYVVKPADGPLTVMPDGYSYKELAPAAEGAIYALSIIKAKKHHEGAKGDGVWCVRSNWISCRTDT